MDRETRRSVEQYRREAGQLENNVVDELLGGEVDRQEFLQRATMFGLSATAIGALLRYVGEADIAQAAPMFAKAGGTLRAGITAPASPLEPYLLNDGGALAFCGIPGE